jgi:hypothetical protein
MYAEGVDVAAVKMVLLWPNIESGDFISLPEQPATKNSEDVSHQNHDSDWPLNRRASNNSNSTKHTHISCLFKFGRETLQTEIDRDGRNA